MTSRPAPMRTVHPSSRRPAWAARRRRPRDRGEELPGLRRAHDRRRDLRDWEPGRRGGDRGGCEGRPVEAVSVHAAGDAGDPCAVRPLPEHPAEPAPARTGQDGKRGLRPVRDPERMPGRGEDRGVSERPLPEARRDVDQRPDSEARSDLVEPGLRPRGQPRAGQVARLLDVEHREEVAALGLRVGDEVVRLSDCAGYDRGIRGSGRAREVVRADLDPERGRPSAVDRIHRVGEVRRLGRLGEREVVAGRPDLDPVDLALPVRDVDPVGRSLCAARDTERGRACRHEHQTPQHDPAHARGTLAGSCGGACKRSRAPGRRRP